MEEAATMGATGVLADGTPAPPLPPLLPPPARNDQQHQHQPPKPVSRYRSLRGKSVSSPVRQKGFDIFRDKNDDTEDGGLESPTRNRSQSAASRRRGYAAKEPQPKRPGQQSSQASQTSQTTRTPAPTTNLPLNPKSVNVPSPASSTDRVSQKALRPSKSLNIDRLKSPFRSPPPPPTKDELSKAQPPETDDEARQGKDREEAARWAGEVARLEAETDRILAEQKKRDLARLQAQLAATPSPKPKPKPRRLILDKLSFLSRGSRSNAHSQPSTPKSAPAKIFTSINWSPPSPSSPPPQNMSLLEHGAIDAPASASNGGERRVTVRCLSSTINLEVTQDTNPVDIAYTTAKLITHKINPGTSVVFECYEELGLERRLRCYESIRDVMNSWDRDHQNSLLIMSYCSPPDTADLELASVPKTDDPPTGFTFQLHHSARPGKWNKRWITLMDSGQIFAAKRPESKSTDKDSAILCHMSDFDIFTPSQNDVKHLKPPKKFCYAIKSQQKTSVFPDGANFIHFFSVEEEDLAQRFHELVFGWRSWYLANKRLNTQGPKSSSTLRRSITSATRNSSSISRRSSCRERPSGEKNSYHIGESKPLIDMQRFNKPIDEFGKGASSVRKSVDAQSTKSRGPPPSLPQPPQSGSEFLAGGLLGDSYDRRKQADAITAVKGVEGPFTEGPSLLNGLRKPPTPPTEKTEPNSWFPSALEHSARSRNQSRPPQFRRPTTADTAQLHRDKLLSPSSAANMPVPDALRSRPSQRQGVGGGVKPPVGSPLINFATGGATSNQPMPSRSSSNGAPNSGRHRSHSTATTRSGGQRYVSPDQPPIPPLPYRSMRRPDGRMHTEPTRGHNGCPQEPLINRVK